jgi:hypothetical protein
MDTLTFTGLNIIEWIRIIIRTSKILNLQLIPYITSNYLLLIPLISFAAI